MGLSPSAVSCVTSSGGSDLPCAADACPVPSSNVLPPSVPLPPCSPFLPSIPSIPPIILSDLLRSIRHSPQPKCQEPIFQFAWSPSAASHNMEVLRRHNFDLGAAIDSHPFCAVSISLEFRSSSILASLLDSHPLWASFHERISTGSDYPLCPLPRAEQESDLVAMIARGNHQSAKVHAATLEKMLRDEVLHGWQLPLPIAAAHMIPSAVVAPLGMVTQFTINEQANRIEKFRLTLTHDQSFNIIRCASRSVNDHLLVHELNPCRFARAFLRFIHYLAHLRHRHPTHRILMTKVDCKSAYRQVHLTAATAVQAMVIIGGFLLVALHQTFGDAANPSQWSDISEVATDLANDLACRLEWDPSTIHSPHMPLLDSAHDPDADADPSLPFTPAAPLGLPMPDSDNPKFDCYIDDICKGLKRASTDKSNTKRGDSTVFGKLT